jgi:hypothetical protein
MEVGLLVLRTVVIAPGRAAAHAPTGPRTAGA